MRYKLPICAFGKFLLVVCYIANTLSCIMQCVVFFLILRKIFLLATFLFSRESALRGVHNLAPTVVFQSVPFLRSEKQPWKGGFGVPSTSQSGKAAWDRGFWSFLFPFMFNIFFSCPPYIKRKIPWVRGY